MTALTLALVVGLAVGSDGEERITTETQERFLAIGEYWEGVVNLGKEETGKVKLEPGWLSMEKEMHDCKWTDEGGGKCLCSMDAGGRMMPGIYKQEPGQRIICLGYDGVRPTRFQGSVHAGGEDILLILKPAKPPKK